MEKDECLAYMQSLGYKCYLDSGCIMIKVDHALTVEEHKGLEKVFKNLGYEQTWGWKVFRDET